MACLVGWLTVVFTRCIYINTIGKWVYTISVEKKFDRYLLCAIQY